ncbi:unnamed protein product [Closterium sp. NIES-65]|nr:unnamed protein product [Closterium sp. NIES-65]
MRRRQSLSLLSAHLRRLQQHNGHVSSSDAAIALASSLHPSLQPSSVASPPEPTSSTPPPPPPVMPAELAAVVEKSLCAVLARHQHLEELLSQPDTSADDLARAGKEMSDLAPAVAIALELQKKTKGSELPLPPTLPPPLRLLAPFPPHSSPLNPCVCASTGGDEAALFETTQNPPLPFSPPYPPIHRHSTHAFVQAQEATRQPYLRQLKTRPSPSHPPIPPFIATQPMRVCKHRRYQRFCAKRGWQFEVLDVTEIEKGGYKEASASVSGDGVLGWLKWESGVHREASASVSGEGVFGSLKWESGVHRVQRVPATEKSGRVHTSAATVAVLPQADEVSIAERCRGVQRVHREHRVQRVPATEKAGRVHTSAATVAVLPQADEVSGAEGYRTGAVQSGWACLGASVDVSIRQEDLRIDTYRSGGCGGQSVDVLIRQEDLRIDTYRSGGCGWRAVDVSIRQEDLRIDTYRSGGCGGQSVDVLIRQEDLRIDTYRSGGCGGQSVNTTNSAVRITHLPSGLVVAIQDERSQHMNKAKALKVLRARLFDLQRKQAEASRSQLRHGQIGSGDRSERIRTYNFPQGRITDHRVGLTLHSLPQVLQGEGLEAFIEALEAAAEKEAIDGLAKAG